MALTEQQKRFADNYIVGLNATKAAEEAGYSSKSRNELRKRGCQLLKNEEISEYISNKLQEMESDKIIKAEELQIFLTTCIRGEKTETRKVVLRAGVQTPDGKKMFRDNVEEITTKISIRDMLEAAKIMAKILMLVNGERGNKETAAKIFFDTSLPEDIPENNN